MLCHLTAAAGAGENLIVKVERAEAPVTVNTKHCDSLARVSSWQHWLAVSELLRCFLLTVTGRTEQPQSRPHRASPQAPLPAQPTFTSPGFNGKIGKRAAPHYTRGTQDAYASYTFNKLDETWTMNVLLVVGIVKSKNYFGSDFRLHWLQKSPNLFFFNTKGRFNSELKYEFLLLFNQSNKSQNADGREDRVQTRSWG